MQKYGHSYIYVVDRFQNIYENLDKNYSRTKINNLIVLREIARESLRAQGRLVEKKGTLRLALTINRCIITSM